MPKYLITGGSGSLAGALIEKLLERSDTQEIRLMARNEHKLLQTKAAYDNNPKITLCCGDVRNRDRVDSAIAGVDYVIHAAALKQVPLAEAHPAECYRVNVEGTEWVCHYAIKHHVKKVMFISSDKSVAPINIYGMCKAVAARLCINSNGWGSGTKFAACLYGNVLNSNGSVLQVWKRQLSSSQPFTLTDPSMTRFFITLPNAAAFVLSCLVKMDGGETFIPIMKSITLKSLWQYWLDKNDEVKTPSIRYEITGMRPGEKVHECLISADEINHVTKWDNAFIRWPDTKQLFDWQMKGEAPHWTRNQVEYGYNSNNADRFMKKEIMQLLP